MCMNGPSLVHSTTFLPLDDFVLPGMPDLMSASIKLTPCSWWAVCWHGPGHFPPRHSNKPRTIPWKEMLTLHLGMSVENLPGLGQVSNMASRPAMWALCPNEVVVERNDAAWFQRIKLEISGGSLHKFALVWQLKLGDIRFSLLPQSYSWDVSALAAVRPKHLNWCHAKDHFLIKDHTPVCKCSFHSAMAAFPLKFSFEQNTIWFGFIFIRWANFKIFQKKANTLFTEDILKITLIIWKWRESISRHKILYNKVCWFHFWGESLIWLLKSPLSLKG